MVRPEGARTPKNLAAVEPAVTDSTLVVIVVASANGSAPTVNFTDFANEKGCRDAAAFLNEQVKDFQFTVPNATQVVTKANCFPFRERG